MAFVVLYSSPCFLALFSSDQLVDPQGNCRTTAPGTNRDLGRRATVAVNRFDDADRPLWIHFHAWFLAQLPHCLRALRLVADRHCTRLAIAANCYVVVRASPDHGEAERTIGYRITDPFGRKGSQRIDRDYCDLRDTDDPRSRHENCSCRRR